MQCSILNKVKLTTTIIILKPTGTALKTHEKSLKSILNIKNISAEIPKTLTVDGTTISNPMKISNIFNNCFSSIASKTKLNISFSHKHFSDFFIFSFFKIDLLFTFL